MFNFRFIPLLIGICCLGSVPAHAQVQRIADSLETVYHQTKESDTSKYELLLDLSFNEGRDLKKGLHYADELIRLSEQNGEDGYLRQGYFLKGTKERLLGNLDGALLAYFKSAEIARKTKHLTAEGESYGAIADIYSVGNNHGNAILYYNKAISTLRVSNDSISLASFLLNAGDEFRKTKNVDSALLYFEEAKLIFDKAKYLPGKAYSLGNIGMVYASLGTNYLAEKNINEAIQILETIQDYYPICDYLISMGEVYLNKGDHSAALDYTLKSRRLAIQHALPEQIAHASAKLSDLYEKAGQSREALTYYKEYILYRDSINNLGTVQKMADLRTDYEVSQKQVEVNMLERQKAIERKLTVALGTILGLVLVILIILLINFRNKQRAFRKLDLQKKETERQKIKAEEALSDLKLTQTQLVQTAKMASLGELTAGIAHEIQNPLNFVNNFSDLSSELLIDLREATAGKLAGLSKAEADEIINVLSDNIRKIGDHGKRADAIVKSMLQHSKSVSGNKEPTDLNTLADEYLRLSYQGLRAKDKSFKAAFSLSPDNNIGKVDVAPQDIGRVILNLCNNAFYAVNKKKQLAGASYEPFVLVTTKKSDDHVALTVRDNGTGIPANLLDKIFQPFFTTKPTGQGTGLGLSLSYDIVKAHGGELSVRSREGEYTEVTIQIPVPALKSNRPGLL